MNRYHPIQLIPTAPLVHFRMLFGLMMALSAIRFYHYGWIESLYIEPIYFFSYFDGLVRTEIPRWTTDIIKFQLALVYIFAGIAKLNPDWLFRAMPLKLWLPAQAHVPIIGPLLSYEITPYIFSWSGALYDLFIVFFLLYRPTRWLAYLAVIGFHPNKDIGFPGGSC